MTKPLKALVIEDDDLVRRSLSTILSTEGWIVHESKWSDDPQLLSSTDWHAVICEIAPENSQGFRAIQDLLANSPNTKVVLTTSQPTALGALDATALGMFDYVSKPLDLEEIRSLCQRLRQRFNSSHSIALKKSNRNQSGMNLIGKSSTFLEVMKQVGRVAATTLPVLLTGESGTGKEVVASALHQRSKRGDGPFIALNCGAMPADLIESELFGHAKGSFTGADRDRRGLWEEAAGGTILLDEITETTLSFQVKLLRTLQEGQIRRVGSNQMRQMDVRVIAASNRDVEQEIEAGRFRQDLFYRLNAVSINLPPLRKRREDIPLLIEAFAQRASVGSNLRFSAEVFELLNRYPWPGNVRELEHAIVSSVAMCDGLVLVQDLPERIRNHRESITSPLNVSNACTEVEDWQTLADVEADYVSRALAHSNWNKQATAMMLKVDRKTLGRMIRRHNILRPATPHNFATNYRAA
jgi:DNA-binding NtrC family response regulator